MTTSFDAFRAAPDHDEIAASLGEFTIRLMRHLGRHEARLATLEERVELLARLHDEVAADVSWMEAVSRDPVEHKEDGPAHEG